APSPYGLGRGKDVQIAAARKQLVAVWPTAGQGWGGTGPLASAWSQDAGQHWQPGPPPAPGFAGGEGYAAIKADAKGRFHLVWLDSRNGKQALYSAQSDDGGQNWGDPLAIDAASCECCTNELAVSPGGKMLVLYRDIEPRDMALAELAGGQKWQRRAAVGDFNWHFDGCPEAGGNLAVADGMLHALIWTGKPGAAGVYHLASVDGGHSWSRPQWLADVGSHHLALAARNKGHLATAWGESNGGDVVVAVSNDGGENWSRRERFADSSHPRLLATPTGWLLAMLRGHVALVFVRL
ncbi:MAG: glycoside hydrolase, partial [Salinisphaera sp.]|nr:glycoside hydrolase [Salinisphaera sp.]